MRKVLFLFSVSIFTIISSCNSGKGGNKDQKNSALTSVSFTTDTSNYSLNKDVDISDSLSNPNIESEILKNEDIKVDTIIKNYHISYTIKDNNEFVHKKGIYSDGQPYSVLFADRSVYLNLKNKEKEILQNEELNKHLFKIFMGSEHLDKYLLQAFEIHQIKDNSIIFSFYICMPDTDLCYRFYIHVNDFGVSSVEWIDEGEMGE